MLDKSPKSCNLALGTLLRGRETVDIHACATTRVVMKWFRQERGKAKGEGWFYIIYYLYDMKGKYRTSKVA